MIINKHVLDALKQNKPVVALESTIISHGMPYPRNVQTALEVEQVVIDNGAVPATIGIIDGEIIIGMTKEQIEEFGIRKGIVKVSRRDLAIVKAKKWWGATTVAATMICAKMAGIKLFVTGGIGGVHRGAQQTFDISADLEELANTDVTVVCAGAKAILDLPLTLEYLETHGVPVLSYKSEHFGNFYTRNSGLPVDCVFNDPSEAGDIINAQKELGLKAGILISNPIPEEYAMDEKVINDAIDKAILAMNKDGIKGKACTPYLLKMIVELTGGDSLDSNIALVKNNAKLGAQIAQYLK